MLGIFYKPHGSTLALVPRFLCFCFQESPSCVWFAFFDGESKFFSIYRFFSFFLSFARFVCITVINVRHSNPHVDPSLDMGPEDHAHEPPIKHTSTTITKSQSTKKSELQNQSITDVDLDTTEPGHSVHSRTTNTQHSSLHKSVDWWPCIVIVR